MKRDMDKVRGVLLAIEEKPSPFLMLVNDTPIGGTDNWPETTQYIAMLESAGFLQRHPQQPSFQITWAGHEFLDSVRDPEIWTKTKDGAKKVGSASLALLTELAAGYLKIKAQSLGLPMM